MPVTNATKATRATSAINATGAHEGQHVGPVHERLRAAILRGEIPAGAATSQAALAKELDAGRTPLREALRMLQREGLVISEPNRRVRIAELSGDDAEELYIMRITLEAVAIRITVPTLDLGRLRRARGLHGADGPLHASVGRPARDARPRIVPFTSRSSPPQARG